MAAEDTVIAGPDVAQQEKKLSPLVSDEPSAPLDFSELTPRQFGISVQSFTPKLSPNCKDKSRVAQMKAKRRSAIGARGSPETNSLIRFMAQQRMKTPKASQTPEEQEGSSRKETGEADEGTGLEGRQRLKAENKNEIEEETGEEQQLVRSSPFLPRVASTLRQKMASFQILMDVEENDACDPKPAQDGGAEGCIRTRDYLSDGSSHDACKENNPPVTPTPSKRRRLGPHEGCSQEIREAGAPILHSSLKEQEVNEAPVIQNVTEAPLPPRGSVEEPHAVLIPQALDVNFDFRARSPSRKQQDNVFEVQSPSRPPPVDLAAASPPPPCSPFHISSLPSLLDMKPTEDDGSMTMKKKKKQVRFGGPLSPEVFDKNLPPSTPLQKGGTPAHSATPGGSFQLRSLLKTPQRSESKMPQSQPDLDSPTDFGASPTFSLPHSQRKGPEIVLASVEEKNSAVTNNPEYMWDTQPLNLNDAFQEECLSQTETAVVSFESDLQTSTSCQINAEEEPGSFPETKEQQEAAVQDPPSAKSNRRTKAGAEQEPTSVRSSSRKRKQPEESQPVKRSTRSAAKSASGKMKTTTGGARRWSKNVDHSLYGSREYASKNPSLTPITENLSFISQSPGALLTPLVTIAASRDEAHQNPETDANVAAVTNAAEPDVGNAASWNRRLSGQRARGRALRKRMVCVLGGNLPSEEKENCGDQTAAPGNQSEHDTPEQEDTEEVCALTSELVLCSNLDVKADSSSDEPPAVEERCGTELPVQRKRGRRSSAFVPVLQEQQNHAAEPQTMCEAGRGPGGQAANQQENIQSGSAGQEESRPPSEVLAPWQAEFNFEEVFQPVATRGQRSVRRSLRLRCDLDHGSNGDGAGLAWLPRTSPDSSKEARRRTRGRRLSAALPVPPALPEETQDAS